MKVFTCPFLPGSGRAGWMSKHLQPVLEGLDDPPRTCSSPPSRGRRGGGASPAWRPSGTRPHHPCRRRGHRSPSSASRGTGRAERPERVGESPRRRTALVPRSTATTAHRGSNPDLGLIHPCLPGLGVKRPPIRLPRPWTHCQTAVQHLSMKGWRAAEVFR